MPETNKYAQIIQRTWLYKFKYLTTHRIVKNFLKNGPTINKIKDLTFDELYLFLKDKEVINITKKCLDRIHLIYNYLYPNSINIKNLKLGMYISAYMIVYKTSYIFEKMNKIDQELYNSSLIFIQMFEKICNKILNSNNKNIYKELPNNFNFILFDHSEKFLKWQILDNNKLLLIYQESLNSLYQNEEYQNTNSLLKNEFKIQIENIRLKIKKLGGIISLIKYDKKLNNNLLFNLISTHNINYSKYLTNEEISHEILLDSTFKVNYKFLDSDLLNIIINDLNLPSPCYINIYQILLDIYNQFSYLGYKEKISKIININLIKLNIINNIYNWDDYILFFHDIKELIKEIYLPELNDNIETQWNIIYNLMTNAKFNEQPNIFCKGLEFIYNQINVLFINKINNNISLISSIILKYGTNYEKYKFENKIKNKSITLTKTTSWLLKNNENLKELLNNNCKFLIFHKNAIISYIFDNNFLTTDNCPETLLLDLNKLKIIKTEYQYILLSVIIINIINNYLHNKNILKNIINHLISNINININVEQVINKIFNITNLNKFRNEIENNILECTKHNNKIYKLFNNRMYNLFMCIMNEEAIDYETKDYNEHVFIPIIINIITKLKNIININFNVHNSIYKNIIIKELSK